MKFVYYFLSSLTPTAIVFLQKFIDVFIRTLRITANTKYVHPWIFYLHASLRIVLIVYMIYTVSARFQSYEQINFDLLDQMSSFVVVSLSKDCIIFYFGLLNSIVSFFSDTAETNETDFVDTSQVGTLKPSYGKLVNSILIPGKLPLNFLVNY